MTRQFAIVRAHRATVNTVHGKNRPQRSKVKPFVVAVVKCSLCHIRRKCVNAVCAVCAASLEG